MDRYNDEQPALRDGGVPAARVTQPDPPEGMANVGPLGQTDAVPRERWLIFRDADGIERFGRVDEEDEQSFTVRMPDNASRLVQRERGTSRIVREDSLELLQIRVPGALSARFAEEPLEVIVDLLQDQGVERAKEQLVDQLNRYGISLDVSAWKKLQPKLVKHPNVAVTEKPVRYRWVERRLTDDKPEVVLTRALATRVSSAERRKAVDTLQRMVEEGALGPTEVALARHAGVKAPAVDWTPVRIDGLDDGLAQALLAAAAEANAWEFLLSVAVDPARRVRAVEARAHFLDAPQRERDRTVVAAIRDWAASLRGAGAAAIVELLERRLPVVARVAGEPPAQAVAVELVGLVRSLVTNGPTSSAKDRALALCLHAVLHPAASAEDILIAFESGGLARRDRDAIRAALSAEPFTAGSPRARLLAALWQWDEIRGELTDRGWWEGVDLAGLVQLAQDDSLAALLADPGVRTQIVHLIVERTLARDPSALGSVLALPAPLLAGVPAEILNQALSRLDDGEPLARLLRGLVKAGRLEERKLITAEQASLEQTWADLRQRLEAEVARLSRDLREAEQAGERLCEELQSLRKGRDADRRAQLRQAQLDALRAVANLLFEAELLAPLLHTGALTAEDVVNRLLHAAAAVDVRRHASVGKLVALDRSRYELVGQPPQDEQYVQVVEPAYLTGDENTVTTLRYGKVTSVAADRQDRGDPA